MIRIDTTDLRNLVGSLDRLAKEMPYAVMRAINNTAFQVRTAEQAEISNVFDRPTPWLLKTIYVTKATTQRLSAAVGPNEWFTKSGYRVGHSTPWERVLAPHVYGGKRINKAFENRLRAARLLPDGWYAVPGQGAKLDAYGNMRGGDLVAIMSWIGAMGLYAGDNMNKRAKQSQRRNKAQQRGESYFALRTATHGLAPGVYKKTGRTWVTSRIKPVLIFVNKSNYRKRLDYYGVANRVVNSVFEAELIKEVRIERIR
ncbi:hypothetical protein HUU62_08665 [Rhodoferax sp. 4810]|uniref:Uncharacterized protein n=1 Tax=Thiospirillum jenense TaxID=1653858 RepID=A0A839HEE2_9GAMM|nr:hypothetical protein [Thiospirillum jenense]MBB1074481.1 hypothetical protein [Rhodoferax jenense]MBB1125537.1 hypothetical protein [Thiospirillum jenense]